jgi:hypothetical protein
MLQVTQSDGYSPSPDADGEACPPVNASPSYQFVGLLTGTENKSSFLPVMESFGKPSELRFHVRRVIPAAQLAPKAYILQCRLRVTIKLFGSSVPKEWLRLCQRVLQK